MITGSIGSNCIITATRSQSHTFLVSCFFFSSRRRHTRSLCDWSSDVCSSDLPSAVAAGNVETSQRIADAVFLALAGGGIPVPAQGQGTMNNVTFGGMGEAGRGKSGWTYYETIGGGQGASQEANGPSGVHVGMSNTRNTPIEVLEMEYPLRLKSYGLRWGSGGVGRRAGGDGVVREFEALAPMELSVLAERRRHAPGGAAGGEIGRAHV